MKEKKGVITKGMTLYRDNMVETIAKKCDRPKGIVKDVIKDYTNYIYEQTDKENSVKFLNLFYLDNKIKTERKTLGYLAEEISQKEKYKKYSTNDIIEILNTYEDCIIYELTNGKSISIYGIAKLYTVPELRIRKSGRLANTGYRVKATKDFRKRVKEL